MAITENNHDIHGSDASSICLLQKAEMAVTFCCTSCSEVVLRIQAKDRDGCCRERTTHNYDTAKFAFETIR
uniref:DUF3795 domain-containing protein n=1 Tax=Heterorhabditis bacteriophora TaxID=37862 RepID=A0A1I7XIW7_HETBA